MEFLKYELTPGERHLGIATVRLYGKILLRYKIIPTKDGNSFFCAAASYKMPGEGANEERYVPAFMLDSNHEKEELETFIKDRVKRCMAQSSTQPNGDHGDPFTQAQGPISPNDPFNYHGSSGRVATGPNEHSSGRTGVTGPSPQSHYGIPDSSPKTEYAQQPHYSAQPQAHYGVPDSSPKTEYAQQPNYSVQQSFPGMGEPPEWMNKETSY